MQDKGGDASNVQMSQIWKVVPVVRRTEGHRQMLINQFAISGDFFFGCCSVLILIHCTALHCNRGLRSV